MSLVALVSTTHETILRLLQLDQTGYLARHRLEADLQSTGGRRARQFLSLFPLGSLRYRILIRLILDFVRLEISLGIPERRRRRRRRTAPQVLEVQNDSRELAFEQVNDAEVVVLIPAYNNWSLTETCLRSLMMTRNTTAYNVVVVDDGSTDETSSRLTEVKGLRTVGDSQNRGFLRAVHLGVDQTHEPYIVLLNNDTVVTDGWIDALVETARRDATIGIVGCKLLYPDGTLQEAGSLIFSDGRGINYGKGDIATRPWYEFPREVDYCSGAALLIRRTTWAATGGFDLSFAPAYYEETDLAFAARDKGFTVWYQPAAVVYHFEGESYGRDDNAERRALLERNKAKLLEKWGAEIATHQPPAVVNRAGAAWRSTRGRLLIVDTIVPETDRDSGSIRMFQMVQVLQRLGYAVSFMALKQPPSEPYAENLRRIGVEVLDGRINSAEEIKRLAPFLRVAILSRPVVGEVVEPLLRRFAPTTKIIYDTVDLHYVREARRAELEGSDEVLAEAQRYEALELGLVTRCDATLVVTDVEKTILHAAVPSAIIREVSNIHSPIPRVGTFESRHDLLFAGNFNHLPNRDAVEWFVRDIFPRIRARIPEVRFKIVGSYMPEEIAAIDEPGVDVLGWVPSLEPLYHSVRLVIAPLRYGAGIKGKLGESAAHGVPFVCTSIATEGTLMRDEVDCLNADTEVEFADDVVRLYSDPELWNTLSVNVQRAIERQCSPDVAAERFEELFSLLNVW